VKRIPDGTKVEYELVEGRFRGVVLDGVPRVIDDLSADPAMRQSSFTYRVAREDDDLVDTLDHSALRVLDR